LAKQSVAFNSQGLPLGKRRASGPAADTGSPHFLAYLPMSFICDGKFKIVIDARATVDGGTFRRLATQR
jgi:hypothetical protein